MMIKYHPAADISKGKFILDLDERQPSVSKTATAGDHVSKVWSPPPLGWCKLNTDGSVGANGDAGAGMVIRDHNGHVLLSSCRSLSTC
jgi:hypothetical protein